MFCFKSTVYSLLRNTIVNVQICLFRTDRNEFSFSLYSNSALHIHVSSSMNTVLERLRWGFITMERGIIEVKVKSKGLGQSPQVSRQLGYFGQVFNLVYFMVWPETSLKIISSIGAFNLDSTTICLINVVFVEQSTEKGRGVMCSCLWSDPCRPSRQRASFFFTLRGPNPNHGNKSPLQHFRGQQTIRKLVKVKIKYK